MFDVRRLIALLTLLTLANFTVAGVEPACASAAVAPTPEATTHAHHDTTPPAERASLGHDASHEGSAPHCLTMTHCVSVAALAVEVAAAGPPIPVQSVVAVSIHVPRSSGTAPDLPPPRA